MRLRRGRDGDNLRARDRTQGFQVNRRDKLRADQADANRLHGRDSREFTTEAQRTQRRQKPDTRNLTNEMQAKTSEPRTQRSGVSGHAMPLTPLRCVRGSELRWISS